LRRWEVVPDWTSMFVPETSPFEMVIRGTIVYLAIFVLLRVTVKREIGTMGVPDLLVLVLLADAAQNAMADDYQSITDGLILVATIVGWSFLIEFASFKWWWVRRVAKPGRLLLYQDGRLLWKNMKRELLTEDELRANLRQRGIENLDDVRRVAIEFDGQLSVVPKEQRDRPLDAPRKQML
jgi:uncharacterized membrane protein YcaP (DUF421 family)